MLLSLFICVIASLSVELFFMGTVVGFFQKKVQSKDVIAFLAVAFVVSLFLQLGFLLGTFWIKMAPQYGVWYASTVLFVLGLKMFYDGYKLHGVKQLINPLALKGLLVLTLLTGINSFFIGLAFGLVSLLNKYIILSFILFLVVILLGVFAGFKSAKLPDKRFEFLSGAIYIISAIILSTNF